MWLDYRCVHTLLFRPTNSVNKVDRRFAVLYFLAWHLLSVRRSICRPLLHEFHVQLHLFLCFPVCTAVFGFRLRKTLQDRRLIDNLSTPVFDPF